MHLAWTEQSAYRRPAAWPPQESAAALTQDEGGPVQTAEQHPVTTTVEAHPIYIQ